MNASLPGNQPVQPPARRVVPEAPHGVGGPIGPLGEVSPDLSLLLVAYVGADWRLERRSNSSRWRAGVEALCTVLHLLETRDGLGVGPFLGPGDVLAASAQAAYDMRAE